jgi:hypothetical protein
MKRFLTKVFLFSGTFIIFLVATFYFVKYHSRFKLNSNKNMLIIGNSHPEGAFNDALIKDLANVSASAEPYFYSYFKTKKIIEQNKTINTVFIEFSNDQIDEPMNDWMWGDTFMPTHFPRWALFMDKEAYGLLYDKNPDCFRECLASIMKNNFKVLSRGLSYSYCMGGYKYSNRHNADSLVRDLALKKQNVEKCELAPINIKYLRKLIGYLRERNIKVFLVRAPLHPKYVTYKNEKLFQEILSTQFSDMEFMDFAGFPLSNAEFGDLGHLNTQGAKVFSEWFNRLLSEGLLTNLDKQALINKEIALRSQSFVAKNY